MLCVVTVSCCLVRNATDASSPKYFLFVSRTIKVCFFIDPTTKRTMENRKGADKARRSAHVRHPETAHSPVARGGSRTRSNRESGHSITSSRTQQRRMRRLLNGGNTRSQKTLTQIKFVDCPPAGEGDDDNDANLEYIGQQPTADTRMNNSGERSRKRRNGGSEIMDSTDDTLTQMGWIGSTAATASVPASRHNQLGAARRASRGERQLSPIPERKLLNRSGAKKRRVSEMETIEEEPEPEDVDEDDWRSKRIKTSHEPGDMVEADNFETLDVENAENNQSAPHENADTAIKFDNPLNDTENSGSSKPRIPMTPQKPRGRVIPSSQSPESPEVIYLDQNKLPESPSRPPLKAISHNTLSGAISSEGRNVPSEESKSKELFPLLKSDHQDVAPAGNVTPGSDEGRIDAPVQTATNSTNQTLQPQRIDEVANPINDYARVDGTNDAKDCGSESQRNRVEVVNGTDDESDAEGGECCDTFSQLSDARIHRSQQPQQQSYRYPGPDDQTASRPSHPSDPPEDGLPEDVPQSTAGSDMSILYCRRPMSSHFEPTNHDVPNLSSGGLAELFATQGMEVHQGYGASGNDKDAECVGTEFDRESLPAHRDDMPGPTAADDSTGPPSSPVVLVESSQRSDEPHHNQPEGQSESGSGRGLLTASQLLTESLMESIPGPPGWTSSQNCDTQDEVVTKSCDGS